MLCRLTSTSSFSDLATQHPLSSQLQEGLSLLVPAPIPSIHLRYTSTPAPAITPTNFQPQSYSYSYIHIFGACAACSTKHYQQVEEARFCVYVLTRECSDPPYFLLILICYRYSPVPVC